MSTFGSVRKEFMDDNIIESRARRMKPQYDLIVIDEASESNKGSITGLFHHLSVQPNLEEVTIIFCGDGMQGQPMVNGPPSEFTKLAEVSILDEILPSMSPKFKFHTLSSSGKVKDLCPHTMLDIQYRMHPTISRLSNIIADREVGDDEMLAPRAESSNFLHHHATFLRTNFSSRNSPRVMELGCPVLWVDPYSETIQLRRDMTRGFNVDVRGGRFLSVVEAISVYNLCNFLVQHELYELRDIIVVTPYNDQRSLLKHLLRNLRRPRRLGRDASARNTRNVLEVFTVKTVQARESRCVIMSPVKNNTMRERDQNIGIGGSVNSLYVTVTRAQNQLIFVGDYYFLQRFPTWFPITNFVEKKMTGMK